MPKIKRKKRHLKKEKKSIFRKICASSCCKKSLFHHRKATATTTPSGLTYKIVQKEQVSNQLMVVIFTMGYFEDGNLFDSSYEDVNKAYGTFDENRAAQNGYRFSFSSRKKDGMIPGFWKD
jgi:FKBP-type peptidyl-prolyl cis-trans isomerase